MLRQIRTSRAFSVALLLTASVAIAACSKKPKPDAIGLGAGQGQATPGSVQDFSLNVGDRVLFETDSSQISAEGRTILDRQAQWLNQYGTYSFTLEGHADERGTREYNIALGARRANAAKNYLISRGVSAGRIRTISFGKERPVAVCNDISCWSQNRRSVTVLDGPTS
ncbi:MAG: peptidoglycan-associated lipoprotein Pal [Pseudomonadota bacterium]